jgi:subtilase family serine protease
MSRAFALFSAVLVTGSLVASTASVAVAAAPAARVCDAPAPGQMTCMARVSPAVAPPNKLGALPYSPATIKSAYGFPTSPTAGAGKTIAIVDAFDNDRVQADLETFDNHYGLPACTKANGCFRKVNQNGGTASFPPVNKGWAQEIALDVEWAHAIAPAAHILLVEARTTFDSDLFAAEDYAVAHADEVSNSWGGGESSSETALDAHFVRLGVNVFVSAGDEGFGAEYPSSSPNVISVGGTSLTTDALGHWVAESGWSGGGGGCSAFETAPVAQSTFVQYPAVGCRGKRATPDISLDADPNTGVAVFDNTHWYEFGGTSVSSPIMAGRAAATGIVYNSNAVYHGGIGYRDITTGSNGKACVAGYDLCTGRGTQIG